MQSFSLLPSFVVIKYVNT